MAVIVCLWVCACGVASTPARDLPSSSGDWPATADRIIIKLREPGIDPARAGFLDGLFDATGVRLIYVRPLAGGAHLFQISRPAQGDAVQSVLQWLGTHPNIEYAEPDYRRHKMQ